MAKYRASKRSPRVSSKGSYSNPEYGTYKDRNLAAMSPEAAQEALKPTDAEPVPMQKRMAGCS